MTPLTELIDRVEYLTKNLDEVVIMVAESQEDLFKQINQRQLFGGQDAKGEQITPSYTTGTVQIKKRKGQPTDRVTLKDTGDFYDSIFVVAEGDKLYIAASDDKLQKLVTKYGPDILGIAQENLGDVCQGIYDPLLDFIKKVIYDRQ